ncbi:MAG: metallophosphoesterase [Abditibacteriales bacterium]|nr:metallophosphoesterase [Abditibacteriales bacterium]
MSARRRRRIRYTFIGVSALLACYFALVRPPFHSLMAQWGVRGAVSALLIYMILIEPRWLRVTRQNVIIERLPASLDGLRIAHVTDLHVGALGLGRADYRRVIQCVEGFQPDLIALTGDFVARNTWLRLRLRECLPLRARHGCFAVLGNADRRHADALIAELRALGVKVLINSHELVNVNDTPLAVVGVNNPSEQLDDLDAALRGMPANVGLTLLLAHAPDIAKRIGQHEIDLILVGHTHGGQVRIPLLHYLTRKGVPHFRQGWFHVGKAQMYVNRGIGQVVSFRFLCPPEVALFTLKRE